MNEDKLNICFEKGCPNYGHCSNMLEFGVTDDDKIECVFYWLIANNIQVRNNDNEIISVEEMWHKAAKPNQSR